MDKHFKIYRISDAKIPVLYDEDMDGIYSAVLIGKHEAALLHDWRAWKKSTAVPALYVEEATSLQVDSTTCRSLFCCDEKERPVIILTLEQIDGILIDRLNTCAVAKTLHGSTVSFTMKNVDSTETRRQKLDTQRYNTQLFITVIGFLITIIGLLLPYIQ